jgi:acyl carrier protein phosphodiesterase
VLPLKMRSGMNWLAHALLSTSDPETRLGNLMADFVKGSDRAKMPESFLEGVRLHQTIDAFTDSHPVVHRSRSRLGSDFRHATGIIIDIYYDHLLICNWNRYSSQSVDDFIAGVYGDIRRSTMPFSEPIQHLLDHLVNEDWLGSYAEIDGIEDALRRVSERLAQRTGRDLGLEKAMASLTSHFDELQSDFNEFFPQLQQRVAVAN